MDGYVAKPVKSADLFDAIRSLYGDSSEVFDGDGLDWDEALDHVDGSEQILRRVADLFFDECPQLFAKIREAIANGDGETAERNAHTLKGTVRIFCAEPAEKAALMLEVCVVQNDLDQTNAALVALESAIERLVEGLKGKVAPDLSAGR